VSSCEGNAAPYALGALPSEQREAFERHLQECSVCREELAALQVATSALPAAAPRLKAPKEVRRRVLAEVRSDARRTAAPRPARIAVAVALGCLAALVAVALIARGGGETVRTVTAQVRPAGSSVVLRVAASRTQISLAAMPSPGQGRVYEVWTKRGAGAPRATSALFGVTRAGTASTAITAGSAGTSEVLISSEPVGGSSSPTRAPVVVARL
jgi:anti-sigma-K factor RskA